MTTRCKTSLLAVMFLTMGGLASNTVLADNGSTLRDCVREATSGAAVMACERAAQAELEQRIIKLTAAIRDRLNAKERLILEANVNAWESFAKEERRTISLFFAKRKDNLGAQLSAGAVNQLLEQRVATLRAYLHSLPD